MAYAVTDIISATAHKVAFSYKLAPTPHDCVCAPSNTFDDEPI